MRPLAMALLAVLRRDGVPGTDGLWRPVYAALQDLCERYDKLFWEPVHAADRYNGYDSPETGVPLAGLVALLAEFGVVVGDPPKPVITPLGRSTATRSSAWKEQQTKARSECGMC